MDSDRLNPVALLCNACLGAGPALSGLLATRADGGLILIDPDEAELDAQADKLPNPPERVSTLAFDPGDRQRWKEALEFLSTHYGRLDWAVVNAPAPAMGGLADLDAALHSLRSAITLIRDNQQGGAAVLAVDAPAAMKASLMQFVRVAAKEGAVAKVKVNALIYDGAQSPTWRDAQPIKDFDRVAFANIQRMTSPVLRAEGRDLASALELLLADRTAMSGAALVVDAPQPL